MSRIRANLITNQSADGAPTVSNGLIISGVTTTSDIKVGTGATLNVYGGANFSGIVTASSFSGSNINATGVVTATSFVDDGTNLLTEINTKATTGKAIAMAMVFG